MGYAILRVQKLKHMASVRRSMRHSFREQPTPNADPERAAMNTHVGACSAAEGVSRVEARLPERRRSDAVLAIEYLVTASPEAMAAKTAAEQDAYLHDALDWIRERHGAENVVYAGIHRDERTPHLYAYAVPVDPQSGRLNAKRWLGGPGALSAMQTEFAERIGRTHGLERGIEGSKATHQRVRRHYAALNRPVEPPEALTLPDPHLVEGKAAYGQRVAQSVRQQLGPTWEAMTARSAEYATERRRREAAERAAKATSAENAELRAWAAPFLEAMKVNPAAARDAYARLRAWTDQLAHKVKARRREPDRDQER